MSVIKYDDADDMNSNKKWKKAVNSSANWIHENQSELKSIQTLIEAAAWSADVKQVNEQHNDDDD